MKYSPMGERAIILIEPTTVTDEVRAFAQTHADATGHVCEVFAPGGVDILYQVVPTPAPTVPATPTALGGFVGWLRRNVTDPDD